MKLTIEIPDAHAGAVLEYVAGLLAKTQPVEATTDPAPGHPELPLMAGDPEDEGNIHWAPVEALDEGLHRAATQMGKTETLSEWAEATVAEIEQSTPPDAEDLTLRDLPFPDGVVPPPLPEGKTRWIYRGNGFGDPGIPCGSRHVMWLSSRGKWIPASEFSLATIHHIEAV